MKAKRTLSGILVAVLLLLVAAGVVDRCWVGDAGEPWHGGSARKPAEEPIVTPLEIVRSDAPAIVVLGPPAAAPDSGPSPSATDAKILVSLTRSDALDSNLAGKLVPLREGAPDLEFELDPGERGQQLVAADLEYSILLPPGWTSTPARILAGRAEQIVRLGAPRVITFRIRHRGEPVIGALAFGASVSDAVATDQSGRVAFSTLPLTPFILLLAGPTVFTSWRFDNGVGPAAREVSLEVPGLEPARTFQVLALDSGMPVPDARVVSHEGVRLPFSSDAGGDLHIPPHGGSLPSLFVEATGYARAVLDLSAESATIELIPTSGYTILTTTSDDAILSGAFVRAYSRAAPGAEEPFLLLAQGTTGADGRVELRLSVQEDPEAVVLLASHPVAGYGVGSLGHGGATSAPGLTRLPLDRRCPLDIVLEDGGNVPIQSVETRTFGSQSVPWRAVASDRIAFPDASMLKQVRITRADGATVEVERHRDDDRLEACFQPDFANRIGGELRVLTERQEVLRGEIQDASGLPVPWQPFRLQLRRSDAAQTVRLHPGSGGRSPTNLSGWVQPRNTVEYECIADGAGQFQVRCIVPGTYYVDFPDPSGERMQAILGPDMDRYTLALPVSGKILVRMPQRLFLDYSIIDAARSRPVESCRLEVTYSSFLQSFRVGAQQHDGGRIQQWIALNPGARVRVSASGYLPAEIPLATSSSVDVREIRLQPVLPMTLEFGATSASGDNRQARAVFELEPIEDGQTQVIESRTIVIPRDGIVLLHAPFPDCIVRIDRQFFRFVPGTTRTMSQ